MTVYLGIGSISPALRKVIATINSPDITPKVRGLAITDSVTRKERRKEGLREARKEAKLNWLHGQMDIFITPAGKSIHLRRSLPSPRAPRRGVPPLPLRLTCGKIILCAVARIVVAEIFK